MPKSRVYSTGQLARRASVSVRTLRFYDRIGLLRPSHRTDAGYRGYTDEDLPRLQQVLALKYLGFSLEEIRCCLDAGPRRLQDVLRQQKAMLQDKREQIDAIIRAIDQTERLADAEGSTWDAIVQVIEVTQMQRKDDWVDKYFTPEQQAVMDELTRRSYSEEAASKLAQRPWTEADQQRIEQEWAAVNAELTRLTATNADPGGPEAQAWAKAWSGLISAFTQDDPEIEAGLRAWWKNYSALPEEAKPLGTMQQSSEEQRFKEAALAIFRERR